jgi:hypothetical protein
MKIKIQLKALLPYVPCSYGPNGQSRKCEARQHRAHLIHNTIYSETRTTNRNLSNTLCELADQHDTTSQV